MSFELGAAWQGIRSGARQLRRTPGFVAAATVTLALGIAANTAMFSVLYGVLLRPIPFDEPDRLVTVINTAPGIGSDRMVLAPAQYFTFRDENRAFDDFAVWVRQSGTLTGAGNAVNVPMLLVTDGFLPVLRVRPVLGRGLTRADDQPGSPGRAVMSWGCWQRRFGGDQHILGRQVAVEGVPYEIVGVLPRSFRFLETDAELIAPLAFDRAATRIQDFSYRGIARLKPGVTIEQARRDVARMIALVPQKFAVAEFLSPSWYRDARIGPEVHLLSADASGNIRDVLWLLMGTIGMVMLAACANVANLFLVRTEGRRHELAVRAALGAGRGRLALSLLSESAMLGLAGGVLGLTLAEAAVRVVRATAPAALPRVSEIGLDPIVIAFAAALSVLAGLLFGLASVVEFASPCLAPLSDGGRAATDGRAGYRTRSALIVSEIALALVLVVSSVLMARTFQALRRVDPGFTRGEEVLTFGLYLPPRLAANGEPVLRAHEAIVRRIETVPGVKSVGLGTAVPLTSGIGRNPLLVQDVPLSPGQAPPSRRMKWILPGHFETLGTRLVAGRCLTWSDVYGYSPVVMVNERLARELWRTPAAALGKHVRASAKDPWREIIGVVANESTESLAENAPPIVYYPGLIDGFMGGPKAAQRWMVYAVRSTREVSPGFAGEVQKAVWSVDRALAPARLATLDSIAARSMAQTSFALVMLGIAASVSLLLGLVGIYGVVAYSTTRRTREVGIRVALGARSADVTRLFVGHGLVLIGLGVGLGVPAAAALSHLMASMLFGVSETDPVIYAVASAALAAVALLAVYVPSRRAARVDPAVSLRGT